MKIDIESLLKENNRLREALDTVQKENAYRIGIQSARESEMTKIINENKKLKSKLYWWQK